ncbi:type 1 glutamine amidotransferase [Diaphorobacter caeni]|uniref:type 1 glutamine amidotransferase n=1 Tax=Diaphorobacter caeni TaxID=2784387 RepID=UPI00189002B0|nr:type 1 glutamine amidotransferase [Diaphorobacter caeni]MBF5005692.1 type 1 glutamine amidotransferase [Diaphorobacter caeni]
MTKPVAILQHETNQGPGVLLDHLQHQDIPYQIICPPADGTAPHDARAYRGIIILGSNHGVNEQLAWMQSERALLQSAIASDIPVLGHCFGAQMLAHAMGAKVSRNACPNIGWSQIWVTPDAQHDLQIPAHTMMFNWHYDTFEIPRGATRTMYGTYCLNKGFRHGRNWAFQGHFEVTAQSLEAWCKEGRHELLCASGPSCQCEKQILEHLPARINALHAVARRVYGAWTRQLDRTTSSITTLPRRRTEACDWVLN